MWCVLTRNFSYCVVALRAADHYFGTAIERYFFSDPRFLRATAAEYPRAGALKSFVRGADRQPYADVHPLSYLRGSGPSGSCVRAHAAQCTRLSSHESRDSLQYMSLVTLYARATADAKNEKMCKK